MSGTPSPFRLGPNNKTSRSSSVSDWVGGTLELVRLPFTDTSRICFSRLFGLLTYNRLLTGWHHTLFTLPRIIPLYCTRERGVHGTFWWCSYRLVVWFITTDGTIHTSIFYRWRLKSLRIKGITVILHRLRDLSRGPLLSLKIKGETSQSYWSQLINRIHVSKTLVPSYNLNRYLVVPGIPVFLLYTHRVSYFWTPVY